MNEAHNYLILFVLVELCDTDMKGFLEENRSRMNDNDRWQVFRKTLEGIEFIHSRGLIHRDMKPMNVLMNVNKKTGAIGCKIADLGLAKFKREKDYTNQKGTDDYVKTTRGMEMTQGCGTMLYGAPEQFASHRYGSKVDMYAMGFVLFEIFVGFPGKKEKYKALEGLRRDKQRTLDKFLRRKPQVAGLIAALLRTNPDRRPSCLDIMRDPKIPLGEPTALTPALRAYMEREMKRKRRR